MQSTEVDSLVLTANFSSCMALLMIMQQYEYLTIYNSIALVESLSIFIQRGHLHIVVNEIMRIRDDLDHIQLHLPS